MDGAKFQITIGISGILTQCDNLETKTSCMRVITIQLNLLIFFSFAGKPNFIFDEILENQIQDNKATQNQFLEHEKFHEPATCEVMISCY